MRPVSRLAMLLGAAVVAGACQREASEPAPPPAAPRVSQLPAAPSDEPPDGVLRAYVWECDDGQTLRVRNLYRENAVSIELHEGARRLPLVTSASGAKYADETVSFWSKGGTATFERKGHPAINCTEARAKSLLADAKLRGVAYRAQGNEPGWLVEVGPGSSLLYLANYGQERHEFDSVTTSDDGAGALTISGEHDGQPIEVTLVREPCADDMSGAEFDHRAVVEFEGRELRGCGTAVR